MPKARTPDPAARLRMLRKSRALLVERLATALDYRKRGMSNRPLRLARYTWYLARAAGADADACELISLAAPLHDLGMVGVRESIVYKPGPLDASEWREVRRHPLLGAELIGEQRDPLLALARIAALSHHERWDGKGYPGRLAGNAIPWPGRMLAIVDAFEAMTVTQRHRPPVNGVEAAKRVLAEAGTQFDPAIVEAFRRALPKFRAVLKTWPDRLEGFHNLDFSKFRR